MKILFTLLAGLGLWLPNANATTTLKIATLAPDGTQWMNSFRAAAKEIKTKTQGRVKIRFYPGGVMGEDKSVLSKIRVGQLHGAALGAAGMSYINFDTQIYAIPFAFTDYAQVDLVRKELDPVLIQRLKDEGFVSFGITEGGFAYMMSDKTITTIKAVRARKVWLPEGDSLSRISLEALGVSPVPLSMTDVLTGLQTGLINAVSMPPSATIALQWHTRVKHLTEMPLLYTYGTIVVSEKSVAKLSAEDRTILQLVFAKALQELNKNTRADNQNAFKALANQGISIDQPEAAEVAQWRSTVNAAVAKMSGQLSFSPKLLERFQTLAKKARGE